MFIDFYSKIAETLLSDFFLIHEGKIYIDIPKEKVINKVNEIGTLEFVQELCNSIEKQPELEQTKQTMDIDKNIYEIIYEIRRIKALKSLKKEPKTPKTPKILKVPKTPKTLKSPKTPKKSKALKALEILEIPEVFEEPEQLEELKEPEVSEVSEVSEEPEVSEVFIEPKQFEELKEPEVSEVSEVSNFGNFPEKTFEQMINEILEVKQEPSELVPEEPKLKKHKQNGKYYYYHNKSHDWKYKDDKELYECFISNNFDRILTCKEFTEKYDTITFKSCEGRLSSFKCHGSFKNPKGIKGAWSYLDFKNGANFFDKDEYREKVIDYYPQKIAV